MPWQSVLATQAALVRAATDPNQNAAIDTALAALQGAGSNLTYDQACFELHEAIGRPSLGPLFGGRHTEGRFKALKNSGRFSA